MLIELRPYQKDIVEKVISSSNSTLIQLPTGGGKTIIAKHIVMDLINHQNKKILFLAPKIVLMDQTLEQFKGLRPQKIHGNNKFDRNHNILVSTLQTASRRSLLNPDVIIIDEVHFGYEGKMLEQIFTNYPNSRIIGLSATPYDENGYLLKGFETIINDYNIKYMIQNNYLVPLKSFVLVKPDLSNVTIIAGDYEQNQLSEAVSKNKIIMEIVNTSKPFIQDSLKTIVFAVDINHAEILKVAFKEAGFRTEAIHSESEEDDSEVIKRFRKGHIKVLVSVLKLTTGFDVPETDLAVIARPTKSQNLYKQMVGRVLRKSENTNKQYSTLLDCGNVIENLGKPLEEIIPREELEKIVQKLTCKQCKSENVKLRKSQKEMYWECLDCGFKKYIDKSIFQCENCSKKHGYESNFELVNQDLYLNCECGYETKISTATGEEVYIEVDSGINFTTSEKFISCRMIAMKTNSTVKTVFLYLDKYYSIKLADINSRVPESIALKLIEDINNGLSLYNDESDNAFLTFEEAKSFVCKLKLKSREEWRKYRVNQLDGYQPIPNYIPLNPHEVYANKGWVNTEDWIGLNYAIKKVNGKYLTFVEARDFVRKLELETASKWISYSMNKLLGYGKKPEYIPANPKEIYKTEWIDLNDWLGLTNSTDQDNKYLSYEDAKSYSTALKLDSEEDWLKYYKKCYPYYTYPKEPKEIYKKEWISWEDWLGIDNKKNSKKIFLSFSMAKDYIRSIKLKSFEEWQDYINGNLNIKPPYNVPMKPDEYYKNNGWKNWEDWLGINTELGTKKSRNSSYGVEFLSFKEARKFVRKLGIKTSADWNKYCVGNLVGYEKKPDNIPRSPDQVYRREGWINYRDWLSEGFKSFEEAKKFVKELNLKNYNEWNSYCKGELKGLVPKPYDIPRDPNLRYKKEWKNWEDWLMGNTNKILGEWRDFNKAREFVRSLKIKNTLDWKKYCKGELEGHDSRPADIPAGPDYVYKNDGWIDYGDWLGTFRKRNIIKKDEYLVFEEAREFARSLKLKSPQDWRDYINGILTELPKLPNDIPSDPKTVYHKKGWWGMYDWLGIKL